MKTRIAFGLLLRGAGALALSMFTAACDDASSTGGTPPGAEAGAFDGGGSGGDAAPAGGYEVECTHPGAGAKKSNGMCECPQSLVVFTGTWSGFYTCGESGNCVDKDLPETFTFIETGNRIDATSEGGGFTFSGVVCGEYFVWTGGVTDGRYVECGTLRFTDANHYVKDSCYQYATDGGPKPACDPSFATGCGSQSGICTNTGARAPEAAAPITKTICQ